MHGMSETLETLYGYILVERGGEGGPVDVVRESDGVTVHTATEWLYAFQWAYDHFIPVPVQAAETARRQASQPRH